MATFILLTTVSPEVASDPEQRAQLGRLVSSRLHAECPHARWLASYAAFGPWDYVDIFEAPDTDVAAHAAMIVRGTGHAQTELWPAMPWNQFHRMLTTMLSKEPAEPTIPTAGAGTQPEEPENDSLVTEASEASFPASDPPAYTIGRQHRNHAQSSEDQ